MTALVESAPVRVMRESAVALGDAGLDAAVEAFLAAKAAADEALSNLTRAQVSGPDAWPAYAEHLVDEAQHCWDLLATGWAAELLPVDVREAGTDYVRLQVSAAVAVQPATAPCDWGRSGRAA